MIYGCTNIDGAHAGIILEKNEGLEFDEYKNYVIERVYMLKTCSLVLIYPKEESP